MGFGLERLGSRSGLETKVGRTAALGVLLVHSGAMLGEVVFHGGEGDKQPIEPKQTCKWVIKDHIYLFGTSQENSHVSSVAHIWK